MQVKDLEAFEVTNLLREMLDLVISHDQDFEGVIQLREECWRYLGDLVVCKGELLQVVQLSDPDWELLKKVAIESECLQHHHGFNVRCNFLNSVVPCV